VSKLFVSNPSKQNVRFPYRMRRGTTAMPDHQPLKWLDIPSGGQVEVVNSDRWNPAERQFFVEQLEKHGGREASEAHGALRRFSGLLWRDANPVDEDEIHMGHDAVVEMQTDRSIAQVTNAAQAFDIVANQVLPSGRGGKRVVKESQTEVIQQLAPREKATGKEVKFKLTVDPNINSRTPVQVNA
jgi:hypothetical protein